MASFSYSVIRGLFGIAERVSPRLAGNAAFALFSRTPNPARLSARERQVLKAAAPLMAQAQSHYVASRHGQAVVAHEFAPGVAWPSPRNALVIHGWRSRTEHMGALIGGLRDSGFRVIAIDLPGHGQSPGRRLNMAMAVAAVHAVAARFGPFEAIAGHSFGGAVAVNALAGSVEGVPPVTAERLVLISTPSSIPAIFDQFGRFLGLGPRTMAAMADQVHRLTGRRLEAFVGSRQLAGIGLPTLVIHAPDDKEIPSGDAQAFARAGPHVRLAWAPGLGHRRIIGDRQVIAQATSFAMGQCYLIAV